MSIHVTRSSQPFLGSGIVITNVCETMAPKRNARGQRSADALLADDQAIYRKLSQCGTKIGLTTAIDTLAQAG